MFEALQAFEAARFAASASVPIDAATLKANAAPNAIANSLRIFQSPLGIVVLGTAIVAPRTATGKPMQASHCAILPNCRASGAKMSRYGFAAHPAAPPV